MKYKFYSIRINVTKYDVTFATKGHRLFSLSIRLVKKYVEHTQPTIEKSIGAAYLSLPPTASLVGNDVM